MAGANRQDSGALYLEIETDLANFQAGTRGDVRLGEFLENITKWAGSAIAKSFAEAG